MELKLILNDMNSPLVQGRGQLLSRHHIEQQSSTKVIEQIFSKINYFNIYNTKLNIPLSLKNIQQKNQRHSLNVS